jgi:phosphoglycerate dehydrogenase-like enzyme
VLYREDLVPPPRWPGDHVGSPGWRRTPKGDEEFLAMLESAEVLYDFPRGHVEHLVRFAPELRWVQASMAGAGEIAERAGLQNTHVTITTASGVYSGPLAEFVMMALLAHVKDLDRLRRDKAEKRWREAHTETLRGKTLCIVGMGNIGRAVAERARPFGVHVVGVKRTTREDDATWDYADELYATQGLRPALHEADYVVVTLPSTPETHRLLDAEAISSIKKGAYFVNAVQRYKTASVAVPRSANRGRYPTIRLGTYLKGSRPHAERYACFRRPRRKISSSRALYETEMVGLVK